MATHQYLDASTGYITAADNARLTELAAYGPRSALRSGAVLIVYWTEHGYWIREGGYESEEDKAFYRGQEPELSEHFWRLMDLVKERDCTWLLLDSDGDDDLLLPMHEW